MRDRGNITDSNDTTAARDRLNTAPLPARDTPTGPNCENRASGTVRGVEPPDKTTHSDASRYAQLLEAVGDAVITIDSHHRIVEFNSEAARIFGYTKSEILGQSIDLLLPERSRTNHRRHITSFAVEPTQRRLMRDRSDIRGRRKDGQEFDAEVSISKIAIAGELFFMAIARDVSHQKQLERALRESKQHLEQAQQLAGLGSWEHDLLTGKVTWSPHIYEIFGIDPDIHQPSANLFQSRLHPEDQLRLQQGFANVLAKHETIMSADLRIIRPDGSERILHELSELVWGEDGKPRRQIGTLQDVTEQRLAAARAQLSKEALQRAQALTKLGSWEWDPQSDQMIWSDQLYRLLGLEPGSIAPSLANFRSIIHPADLAHYKAINFEPLRKATTPGQAQMEGYEFRILRPDGSECWVYGQLQSILDAGGHRVARLEGTIQDITERKIAADRLRLSEQLLNRAQELANLGSWEHNETTSEISWSRNFFTILGLDPATDHPSDELFMSILHPDDRAMVRQRYAQALSARAHAASYDTRIVRRDGQERMLRNIVEYFWSESGVLLRINGTSQDVTDQLAVAEKLARSEHSLANAQRIAHIGNWDFNIEAGTLWWSDEIYRIYGLEPSEFSPNPEALLARVHPDDRERLDADVSAALRNERPYENTHRIVLPSGAIRTVHEQAELVLSADGRLVQINGTVQDVTEAKQITDELERNEWFLAQAQRIARMGSWETDFLTGEMRWSAGFYALAGLSPEQHRPNAELFLSLIHPDDRGAVAQRTKRIVGGDFETISGDYRLIRPDGTQRIIQAEAGVINDTTGRPSRIVGTLQDVTEQKAARMELQMALAAARSADKAKSEFLANMSHELRTPLNAIIGFADILSMEKMAPSLTPRDREYAKDIRDSGLHLLDIINDVLDFSRVEAGSATIRDDTIDVNALMAWVVKLLGPKAQAKDLRLTTVVAPEATAFRGDMRLIRQALLNVVGNAIKFTVVGEVKLTAAITTDNDFVLSISDTGIGMRREDIPAALTPFTQLENSLQRHHEGVGLGFPLAKRFVELHGGTLTVDSELQKGTTVAITLPAWRRNGLERKPERTA
jgi:PAS domain S-box-containing protein